MENPTLKKYWQANSSTERIEIVEAAFALIEKQQTVFQELHLKLTSENFSTLVPNNDRKDFYEGYIKGVEKAIDIVNDVYKQNQVLRAKQQNNCPCCATGSFILPNCEHCKGTGVIQ